MKARERAKMDNLEPESYYDTEDYWIEDVGPTQFPQGLFATSVFQH